MKRILILAFLLSAWLFSTDILAANPFTGSGAPAAESSGGAAVPEAQRGLFDRIGGLIAGAREGGVAATALAVLLAGAYGVLHALGPGHRKTLLAGYFAAQPASVATIVGAALAVALLHGASAAAVTYGAYYLLRGSVLASTAQAGRVLELISLLVALGLGAGILVRGLRRSAATHPGAACCHVHALGQTGDDGSAHRRTTSARSSLALVIAGGLVPCPGVVSMIAMTIAAGVPGLGLLVAAGVSSGTAIVVIAAAFAGRGARAAAERALVRRAGALALAARVFSIGGAGLMLAFALRGLAGFVVA